jgi:DUF1365 family protein
MKNNRLYVLVRKDLLCSSPAVQAGHIVAQFCLYSTDAWSWQNQYLIYLGVDNSKDLKKWMFKFQRRNIDIYNFQEPDLNNEITGFCGLVDEESAGFLNKLDLL